MFVRCSALEALGLIDENFFAYGEENDLQLRFQRAGYRSVVVNVPVWHHGSASFGKTPFRASVLQTQNNLQLLVKHGSPRRLAQSVGAHLRRLIAGGETREASTSVERRLRSSSKLMALAVLALASARIMFMMPAILRRRAEDRRRIDAVRARHPA
jgi:GT2 family glycosyltransferase